MNFVNDIQNWIIDKLQLNTIKTLNNNEFKILVMGEKSVGKSSFLLRFIKNEYDLEKKPITNKNNLTINLKFFEDIIKISFIDVDYMTISKEHNNLYNNVHGVFILFDLIKKKTFEKIKNWIFDVRQNLRNNIPICIIGNKKDLTFLKEVHSKELEEKSIEYNCDFFEVSCTEEESVDIAMKFLIGKIYFNSLGKKKKQYFENYLK